MTLIEERRDTEDGEDEGGGLLGEFISRDIFVLCSEENVMVEVGNSVIEVELRGPEDSCQVLKVVRERS